MSIYTHFQVGMVFYLKGNVPVYIHRMTGKDIIMRMMTEKEQRDLEAEMTRREAFEKVQRLESMKSEEEARETLPRIEV